MDLCIVRSGSVERAGASCQLKKSEVGYLVPTPNGRERNTKVRLFLHINKFIFVRNIQYLCGMLNYIIDMMMGSGLRLNTRVENLDRATLREVVKYATQYCTDTFGTRKKKVPFSVSITKQRSGEPAYGQYCPYDNKLFIYHNNCPTVKCLVQTVIHEYTHYLQPVKSKYNKMLDRYGYDNHPMEIEACEMEEIHYKDCWNYIKEILC